MAHAKRLNWIKDCLANRWEGRSEEELTTQILAEESADAESRKRTLQMVSAWQNNQSNVRGKFQILNSADSEALLEEFIQDHLELSKK